MKKYLRYPTQIRKKQIPFKRVSFPLIYINGIIKRLTARRKIKCGNEGKAFIGMSIKATPRMNKMLKMFDPITFSSNISECLSTAAVKDIANSGVEISYATNDKEITKLETPSFIAVFAVPLIRKSENLFKKRIPIITAGITSSMENSRVNEKTCLN